MSFLISIWKYWSSLPVSVNWENSGFYLFQLVPVCGLSLVMGEQLLLETAVFL